MSTGAKSPGAQSTSPPLKKGSPGSPESPSSLHLCLCRRRDHSPSPVSGYDLLSPLPIRRCRSCSESALTEKGPRINGVFKYFSRSKGHGFITPAEGGPDIFVHISDIKSEYVPVEGDKVSYTLSSMPPKHDKFQAVELTITHLAPGLKHETWAGKTVVDT